MATIDTASPSAPRKHVTGGYCIQNQDTNEGIGISFCALSANQCLLGQNFRSSRQTDRQAGFFRKCLSQNSVVKDVYLGWCSSDSNDGAIGENQTTDILLGDNGYCSTDEESCLRNGETFDSTTNTTNTSASFVFAGSSVDTTKPECNIESALFGSCGTGNCVWSSLDCQQNQTYVAQDPDCTCENVKVGGCQSRDTPTNDIICAVAPDSCDQTQIFLTHDEVIDARNISCYLCRPPTVASNTNTATDIAADNTGATTPASTPPSDPNTESASNNNYEKNTTGLVIGITVGGIVIAAIIATVVVMKVMRKGCFRVATTTKEQPPPLLDIDTGKGSGGGVGNNVVEERPVSEIEDPRME